jgi:hypothetical protein
MKKKIDPKFTAPNDESTSRAVPFTRDLACSLTPEEVAELADQSARLVDQLDQKKVEFKQVSAHWKTEIAQVEVDLRIASSQVRDRSAVRTVQCERRFQFATATVEDVRLDTGEVISRRPMSDAEKQRELPGFEQSEDFE